MILCNGNDLISANELLFDVEINILRLYDDDNKQILIKGMK